MRWLNAGKAVTAFLCQLYLTLTGSLIIWAILPLFLGWTPTVVISGSMEPRISVGDVIFADPMEDSELRHTVKLKNVLLAEDPNKPDRLVTHRVVEIVNKGESYITKGDANVSNDSTPVPLENIKGIEKLRVPYIGIPIYALQQGNLVIPGLFVISLIASQLIVRKQWRIEAEQRKARITADQSHTQEELTGSITAVSVKEKPSVLHAKNLPKSIIWVRAVSMIAVPLFLVFSSLMMSASAANWKGEVSNNTNTFETCEVFKKNANQNTSGPNCGNNGNDK